MVLGEKPHRTSTFPLFSSSTPEHAWDESEGWADSKPQYLSLYVIIIIIRIYVSSKSHGPWGSSLLLELCLPPAWHGVMPAPRLQIRAGRASTNAEPHMPKPPQGLACGRTTEPRERGIGSCCRRSRGERGAGARGRDAGRCLQKGQISSERHSCRGATGPCCQL